MKNTVAETHIPVDLSKASSTFDMGTKVEYSINLLATSVNSNNLTVDVWEHYQNKGLSNNCRRIGISKMQYPMERRMLDRNTIESIKKTMQMHEDIFKQQVGELHRLYSVQKVLMDDLKKEIRQKKFWSTKNGLGISHPHVLEQQHKTTQISYAQTLRDDLCSRERSGSCSGDTIKMPRGFDLEMPAEEDTSTDVQGLDEGEAGPSSYTPFESCKVSSDGSDEEMEMDLTLSIGGSQVKKKAKSHLPQLGCSASDSPKGKTRKLNLSGSFISDRVGECSDPTTPMSNSSVTFDQERKEPQWLSQGLKLK